MNNQSYAVYFFAGNICKVALQTVKLVTAKHEFNILENVEVLRKG